MRTDARLTLVAVLACLGLSACAGGDSGKVIILAQWHDGSPHGNSSQAITIPQAVVKLRTSVVGPGLEVALVREFELSGTETESLVIDGIPAGVDRVVSLEGLEADGWPAFAGKTDPVEVKANTTTTATIVLYGAPGSEGQSGAESIVVIVDDGVPATATRDVTVRVLAAGVTEMVLANSPVGFESYASLAWQPYTAGGVAWQLLDGDGAKTVYAVVRDARGLSSRSVASGPIQLDTTGPVVHASLLVVSSNPPGENDLVRGNPGCTEAGATVEIFRDENAIDLVTSGPVSAQGAFSDFSLGDNYGDEIAGDGGQSSFWIHAIDALGNVGELVAFTTDVTPPRISYLQAVPRFIRAGVQVTVEIQATDELAAPPHVELAGYLTPPAQVAVFTCATYAVAGVYQCTWTSAGVEPEQAMDVVATGAKVGSGNVAQIRAPAAVLFDYTPPATVLAPGAVAVHAAVVGQEDGISAPPGTLDAFGILELFLAADGMPSIPASCGGYELLRQIVAGADGSIPLTAIGDNQLGAFRARALDAAGNDACNPACLDSCSGMYCMNPAVCCPMGGTSISKCAGQLTLCNDTEGPSARLRAAPDAVTEATVASFAVELTDNSCAAPSLPLSLRCRLDGAEFADCPMSLSLTVGAGGHRLEYYGVDALGNAPRERDGHLITESYSWRVQPRRVAFAAERLAPITQRSYLIDGSGVTHLFVGGDRLQHFYKGLVGGFSSEVVTATAAENVVAIAQGGVLHLAFTSLGGVDLRHAVGTTGSWTVDTVEYGAYVPGDSLDLAARGASSLALGYNAKSSAGQDSGAFLVRDRNGTVFGDPVEVTSNGGQEARLTFAPDGSLWAYWTQMHEGGSGDRSLVTRQRTTAGWQPELVVRANLGNTVNNLRYPTIAVPADGLPVITYREGYDSEPVRLIKHNGTDFSPTPLDLTYQRYTSLGVAADGDLWYAMAGNLGAPTTGLQRYHGGSLEGGTLAGQGYQVESTSLFVRTPGTIATAVVEVAYSYADVNGVLSVGRSTLNGGAPTTLASGAAIAEASMLAGAAEPTALLRVTGANRIIALAYNEAGDSFTTATVKQGVSDIGCEVKGAAKGADRWVVHRDGCAQSGAAQVFVEHDAGGGWSTAAAVTAATDRATMPAIGIDDLGWPVVAFRLKKTTTDTIAVTWWSGAAFVPLTDIADVSASPPSSIAVIGDANGGAAGGGVWVVYGLDNKDLRVTKLSISGEDTGTPGCETCMSETIATLAGKPLVTAGLDPAAQPVVYYVAAFDQTYYASSVVYRATHTGSAWDIADLSASFVGLVPAPGTNTWTTSSNQALAGPLYYYAAPQFAYTSSGLLRLGLIAADPHGDYECLQHYALAAEKSSGQIEVRGVWPFPSLRNSSVYIGAARRFLDVAALSNGTAVLLVPDLDAEDFLAIREDEL